MPERLTGKALNKPVTGMTARTTGRGYWLLGSDGAAHPFGDGRIYGSLSDLGFCSPLPVVSIAASQTGHGYWLLQRDGHVRSFGDARQYGDAGGPNVAAVALAVMP